MIAKNNIFNIRSSQHYKWFGSDGATKGFVNFESSDFAIRAAAYLLLKSYRIAGVTTIEGIIRRFAPPSENNTDNYIKFVADATQIEKDKELTSVLQYARILSAMAKMETGSNVKYLDVLQIIKNYKLKIYNPR